MSLTKAELMRIPLKYFGLPEERKFPMHDEAHLRAAIAYFWTAPPKKRKKLAENIVKRHRELKSDIKISSKNPLYKYVPDDMKKIAESSIPETVRKIYPLLDDMGVGIVESLLAKNNIDTVEDIDSQVPDEYKNKPYLLGTLKSFILNEDEDFPVLYTDFPLTLEDLKSNNGGIKNIEESILLKYDNTLNESCELSPLKNFEHIQFCALLREWTENYYNGYRNLTYDRLMIDSWKTRVSDLLKEVEIDIKVQNPADKEVKQKLLDLGIKDPEEYDKIFVTKDKIADNSPVHIAAKIASKLTDDIKERFYSSGDDPMVLQNALSITLYTGRHNLVNHRGQDFTYDDEKYRW